MSGTYHIIPNFFVSISREQAMFQLIIFLYSLFQVGFCCNNESSVEKLNKIGGEILESYWESFSVLPYDVANCYPNELNPNYIDETDYVIHLNEIPTDSIKIINIAFASVDLYKLVYPANIMYDNIE